MKQFTCYVGIICYIRIFSLGVQWAWLVPGIGTNTSCVFYIICFQFLPLNKSSSILPNCTWFFVLLVSPYAFFFPTFLSLVLAEFNSSVYISIQFEVSTKYSSHVILHMLGFQLIGSILFSIVLVCRRFDLLKVSL